MSDELPDAENCPLVAEPPKWFRSTLQELTRLLSLPESWDSYGARPINPVSVAAAGQLLLEILDDDVPPPQVVPVNRGTVMLEWHTRDVDLEVEVVSGQRLNVAFADAARGVEWEREFSTDRTDVVACVRQLSRSA